jgi:hypothetical protein
MKVNDYTNSCIKFAADTVSRELDDEKHYQAIGGEWEETADGSTAGISVKWAHGKSPAEITEEAPQQLINEILAEIDASEGTYGNGETAVNFLNWLADILR